MNLYQLLGQLPEGYGKEHNDRLMRFQDYRQVFLGSDAGKRVLADIFGLCGFCAAPISRAELSGTKPVDEKHLMVAVGAQTVAVSISGAVLNEPVEKPTRQTKG